ncbi:hypothetical protein [Actinoplanes aureus]|uniref:Uncharacterized protein n=1 Tax=Actinoplanes aureus TaxID=2792083 RepID=A0A931CKD7_9ACTN|nr:hypothetical protein [Actinoplanes aureus]MBG0568671.1 hypothetical protein [Actinoplanes aureus]
MIPTGYRQVGDHKPDSQPPADDGPGIRFSAEAGSPDAATTATRSDAAVASALDAAIFSKLRLS